MSQAWGRASAAVAAGVLAAGVTTLAWSQQKPSSATPPAPSASSTPAVPSPRAEEPPPPAAEVPTVVAPGPTPEAPPQEISPVPSTAPEAPQSSSKRADDQPKAPPPPPKRTLYNAAIIQAVDKVTAETLRFEVQVRQPVRYKGLIFTLHTCEASPAGTLPSAFAHLEIDSQPQPLPGRPPNPAKQVFKGWMIADAPGLHPLEHPVYDAWLIACKTASGPAVADKR